MKEGYLRAAHANALGVADGTVANGTIVESTALISGSLQIAANVGNQAVDAHVSITFLRENGAPFSRTFPVPATQRFSVRVGPGTEVPELVNERFGALITSDQPIAVERAMYSNAGGQIWAAGTSANATPVP